MEIMERCGGSTCKRDFLYTKSQGQKKSKGKTIKFKTGQ